MNFISSFPQVQVAALVVVQIVVGGIMIYYGAPKLRDLKSNAKDFNDMGFYPGLFWGTLVALLECVGGILIVLGLFGPVIAFLFGGEMITGALWKIAKTNKPFTDYSYDILLFALSFIIFAFGGGWSISMVFSLI